MVGGDSMLVQIRARHPYDVAAFGSIQRYPHQFIGLESSALANSAADAFRSDLEWRVAPPIWLYQQITHLPFASPSGSM
ncbi:hypothetical protein WK26_23370 [Burkholderia vietnamiensis]|nr:hypothetical protein WK26_23370 [Burkholderia vietnamiensis]